MPVEFKSKLPQVRERIALAVASIPKAAAESSVAEMRTAMREPKTGVVYRYRGVSHTASAPGEAPAITPGEWSTEHYADAIELIEVGGNEVQIWSPELGTWLDEGTARMQPRPHLLQGFMAGEEVGASMMIGVKADISKMGL